MILVDSHCHLDLTNKALCEFTEKSQISTTSEISIVKTNSSCSNKDFIQEIVQKAYDNYTHYLHSISTSIDNIQNVIAIAERHEKVFASVGVHPNEVKSKISSKDLLKYTQSSKKVISIGETGLDYYRTCDDKIIKLQQQSFLEHISIAQTDNTLGIIIHTRGAREDTLNIVKEAMYHKNFPGLIHCFSEDEDFAFKMLDLGLYISISGIVTFKNADNLRQIVKNIPLNRLLIETDSPYLAPNPLRGSINEPSYVKYVAQEIARLKNISMEEVALQTTENFFKLFKRAIRVNN